AHALQSNIMSGLVALACPDLKEPLQALAPRVGQNREIAGMHYPSDRTASEKMAKAVLAWCETKLGWGSLLFQTIGHARDELCAPPGDC
ncbi:MAG: hypothetical protein J0H57_05040, partial [Rhodospirillales bacterium]|nr:hypothetical protein [Rhodospirillales bacterium]